MKPFQLKEALEQGYAYTRDKRKVVDLKLSDMNITYRLTGRVEDNPENVKAWTVSGHCDANFVIDHPFDLCYLELETMIVISHNDNFYTRIVDIDQLSDLINFNTDLLKIGELKITIPQQK